MQRVGVLTARGEEGRVGGEEGADDGPDEGGGEVLRQARDECHDAFEGVGAGAELALDGGTVGDIDLRAEDALPQAVEFG